MSHAGPPGDQTLFRRPWWREFPKRTKPDTSTHAVAGSGTIRCSVTFRPSISKLTKAVNWSGPIVIGPMTGCGPTAFVGAGERVTPSGTG
jgi:hypothetical protein